MMEWSIRSLLNPVITRLLIYGVNPIDVEYVISAVEKKNHINSRSLEKSWLEEWEKKALKYKSLAEESKRKNNLLSAHEFYSYAAQCYYAVFLINLSGIEDKRRVYQEYAFFYRKSMELYPSKVEYLEIPINSESSVCGFLHQPIMQTQTENPCVIIYSGLGSCKEEMHTLARPLVDRGITVFIPDMPGNGESLFKNSLKCRIHNLNAAFTRIPDELEKRSDIKKGAFGVYGLCMGGGYAYRAACMDPRYSFCVTLFPLFITQVDPRSTPQWMRQGEWSSFQFGGISADNFMKEMLSLEEGVLSCPYLFVHGKYDNWMTIESAMNLYNKAQGEKEKIIIEEEPVFSNQQVVTHTMPVGEQLHWVRHVTADWMAAHCK
jgi:dienelactone hydrolase